ncbi:MAG: TIGR04282 family arsenosugar biosynthesis glycosyltransferase [Bacteroidota bacterium]
MGQKLKKKKIKKKKNKSNSSALIVFIRVPELGKVKTRLAAQVGDEKALFIYKELLDHTFKICEQCKDVDTYIFLASSSPHKLNLTSTFKVSLQRGESLGERMNNAFDQVFSKEYEKALIIGSDCAQLKVDIIERAIIELGNSEIVIGPTLDGGYYLLGMTESHSFLFQGIEWSTDTVFSSTIQKVENHNLRFTTLPVLSDIDYIEDWENYGWAF